MAGTHGEEIPSFFCTRCPVKIILDHGKKHVFFFPMSGRCFCLSFLDSFSVGFWFFIWEMLPEATSRTILSSWCGEPLSARKSPPHCRGSDRKPGEWHVWFLFQVFFFPSCFISISPPFQTCLIPVFMGNKWQNTRRVVFFFPVLVLRNTSPRCLADKDS